MSRTKSVLIALGAVLVVVGVASALVWYVPIHEERARRAIDSAAAVAAVDALDSSFADYDAWFWNPRSATTAVVTVYRVQDNEWAMSVVAAWDPTLRRSEVLSMERDYNPK